MKQKLFRVSYLVLAFKYSGKEHFRKNIHFNKVQLLAHYRLTFLCFGVGFIRNELLDFALEGKNYLICFISQAPTLFLFVLMRNLRIAWARNYKWQPKT